LLISLCERPKSRQSNVPEIDEDIESLINLNINETIVVDNRKLNIKVIQKDDDSDDDLVPYDLSNDVKISKTKQPAYLRDCLDGLIYSEDVEKIELCLNSVENLCKNYHFELNEVI